MKKIKILLIGMSSNLGGIETFLFNLVKNAPKNKFEFDFMASNDTKIALEEELKKIGCNVYYITPRKTNYFKHINDIRKIYNNNYDYIHISIMDYTWFEPIFIAKKYLSKVILHSHNAGPLSKSIKKNILNLIGKVMCSNISSLRVACGEKAGKFMFGKKDFFVFNNGIDIEKFKFNFDFRKRVREEFSIDEKTTVYGLIAKLEKQKNILFLIDIFFYLTKRREDSKLLIVGEGALKDDILKKAKELKIDQNIILAGKRLDAYKFYSAFDAFVMPSLFEGLSISLCEAQVNGLKCYTTDGVDKDSNITGNVEFLSLNNPPKEWAEYIYKSNNKRDKDVLNKIPDEFDAVKSYEKLYEFYKKNLS